MINNIPNGTDQSHFYTPQEKTYIVEISGFIEVQAFSDEDAEEVARDKILDAKLEFRA